MSTSDTDVVKVIEAHTELRANEWIGGRVELTCDAIWLETEDASGHEVYVITPPCHDWIPFD
jgi:hypothetical protein